MEWPPNDPGNLRVTYDGAHSHPPPPPAAAADLEEPGSSSVPNPYDLRNQVLGLANDPS